MTADELIEKLQDVDKGQHLEVVIEDPDGTVCSDFRIVQGVTTEATDAKVVLVLCVQAWE